MSNITSKQFLDLLREAYNQDNGIESVRSYSGRFMYGKRCIAITGDELNVFAVGVAVAEAARRACGDDEARLHLWLGDLKWMRCSSDSMGRGIVVYWPGMDWPEGERDLSDEPDEDEDED